MNHDAETLINTKDTHQLQSHKPKHFFLLLLVAILIGGADYGVYIWQHNKATTLSNSQSLLNSKISNIKQQISTITNQNNGIVSSPQKTTDNIISLANNKITFTLPSNWVVATASNYARECYNGYFASTVLCLDTTVVVPKTLDTNNSTSTYGGITVSVYKHSDNTTAQDWYYDDLLGGLSSQTSDTTSTAPISGYSTYYLNTAKESLIYGDQTNDEYYVLANKSYVVVVTSDVNNNDGPNGTMAFNDNSQYNPSVKLLAQSIKIQGS